MSYRDRSAEFRVGSHTRVSDLQAYAGEMPDLPARLLVVVAWPTEAGAILRALGLDPDPPPFWVRRALAPGCDLAISGISKANAAGCVAHLASPDGDLGILDVGLAGLLPGSGARLGDLVLATTSVFADEGIRIPAGFQTFREMGFGLLDEQDEVPITPAWHSRLSRLVDREGVIATVSTCSGTDARAVDVRDRTSGVCEACEGAAAGLVARRLGLPYAELRVLSNTTGDRERQRWEAGKALERLGEVIARIVREGLLVRR